MGVIAWIVFGLIAGAIAKLIMPGKDPGGIILTIIIGIVGALVGGFIGGALFGVGMRGFFHVSTWLLAIAGSLIVLFVWGLITKRRTA